MTTLKSVLFVFISQLSGNALSADWESADSLFDKRGEATSSNTQILDEARSAYKLILKDASANADKVRAVVQLSRLAEYEGFMVAKQDNNSAITEVYGDCWCRSYSMFSGSCSRGGFIEEISPEKIGQELTAYRYYKGLCTARWTSVQPITTMIRMGGKVNKLIKKALTMDEEFKGGAIYRLAAGVYGDPIVKPLGYYDIVKSTEYVNNAFATSAGYDYFDNYYGAVVIMRNRHNDEPNSGWKDQAIAYAEEALIIADDLIAGNAEPADEKPEFYFYVGKIKELYKELTGSDWPG